MGSLRILASTPYLQSVLWRSRKQGFLRNHQFRLNRNGGFLRETDGTAGVYSLSMDSRAWLLALQTHVQSFSNTAAEFSNLELCIYTPTEGVWPFGLFHIPTNIYITRCFVLLLFLNILVVICHCSFKWYFPMNIEVDCFLIYFLGICVLFMSVCSTFLVKLCYKPSESLFLF